VRSELLDQPGKLGAVHPENELVGIGKAKFDAVGVAQRLAFHPLTIDINAMQAAGIFDFVLAALLHDAGMLARGSAVAQDQVVIGLAADFKGQRRDFHAGTVAAGVDDDYRG